MSTKHQAPSTKHLSIAFAAAVSVIGSANAATISWSRDFVSSSVFTQTSPGIFDKTGTLVFAENSGGAALTFDGIDFAAPTISFGNTRNNFRGVGSSLAQTGTRGDSGSDTVSLTGLTIGSMYRVQALLFTAHVNDFGASASFDGVNQGGFDNPGIIVTGTFVADAAAQDFTIEAFIFGSSQGGQLNAITLYQTSAAVPEPSSAALLGLGGLALILRRRK